MRTLLLNCLLAALAALPALAQAQAPVPAATFFQTPGVVEAKLSPGGKRLAFRSSVGGDRYAIAVLDLSDGLKAYKAASFNGADVTDFDWVNDDRLVFSGADLHDYGASLGVLAPGLYSVNFDGQRPRTLVKSSTLFDVDGDAQALPFNHLLLAVPQPQPGVGADDVVIANYSVADKRISGLKPMWLDTLKARSGYMATDAAPGHVLRWWFDSAGRPRAAYTEQDGRGAYHWRGPQDTAWRRIAEADEKVIPFHVVGVDDAGALYVTEASGPGDTLVLKRFDFKTGAPETQPLVATPGFDFEGSLIHGKPGSALLGVRLHADAESTVWFNPAMQDFQQAIDAKLPGQVNRIDCVRCGEPDMVALVTSYADRDPGTLYLYDAATRKLHRLLKTLKGIEPAQMARVSIRRIQARDGREIPVWLTTPANAQAGQPLPTVVMVHGGPQARIGYWYWDAMNQFLASRGYLVIEPEFRGSEGYGVAHTRAGFKQWGQAMEDDLADALLWAQKQGLSQEGRACIAGASYGGYAALMGPVRFPGLFRCVAAWAGVADLELLLDGSWRVDDDISAAGRRAYLPDTVGDFKADAAMLRANNPVLLADRMKAPVLLVYGEADRRVPLAHGKRMRDALTAAGSPPEWFTFRGESHGWTNPTNQVAFAERLAAFLQKHLP